MEKLKLKYSNKSEKIRAEYTTDSECTCIDWYIANMCKFLVAIGYSVDVIQKYIKFDGYEVYKFEDWEE